MAAHDDIPNDVPDDDSPVEGNHFTDGQVRRGLRVSFLATALGSVYYQLLQPASWLVVMLLTFLGASKVSIGILAATMPLARFCEVLAAWSMQRTGRRRELFTWAHIVSRLLWIPLVLTCLLSVDHAAWRTPLLFVILLVSGLLTWLGSNAWLSWMGDLIPPNIRGRYFGTRQVFETGTRILATFAVAKYLAYVGEPGAAHYITIVCALVTFGVLDILVFRFWVPHPVLRPTRERMPLTTLLRFVSTPLRDRRYRRFVVFIATWMFASGLMGPYIWVFVNGRDYLGLSAMFNFEVQLVSGFFYMLASFVWGHMGDRWPVRRLLALCVLISVTPPFDYLFATREATWPIYLAWTMGTVAWAGIFVYSFQYGISLAPARERSMVLAFQSAVLGLVGALAYLAAAGLVKLLEGMEPVRVWGYAWTDLQLIFCLAGVGRLLSLIPLSRMEAAPRE